MSTQNVIRATAIVGVMLMSTPLFAMKQGQQGQGQGQGQVQGQRPEPPPPVRVRLKILVAKVEGQKVTASIPFEMIVKAGAGQTTLNHGKQVPMPQSAGKDGVSYYGYQSIGSNLAVSDLSATALAITFQLMIDISALEPTSNPTPPANQNVRKYSMQSTISVKPTEPTMVTVSTDSITGETVRLTVTADIVR